ncbi:MAG: CbtB-domain containing protein [Alphaproteobacteria bacterium]|nr:CbtB-domain containing protein [Alphaproteobacteria bacterium]MBM3951145.1 CbtB-domain containing protein [Rhodospirillales bacterium]
MTEHVSAATAPRVVAGSTTISKPIQLAGAFLFGMVMLFGAGFVQTAEVHNAAHDARHAIGFPCH